MEISSILYWFVLLVAALVSSIPAAIFTEGLTELLSKSLIFSGVRAKFSKDSFIGSLIRCGYCTSVWVAIFPALFYSYMGYLVFSSVIASLLTGFFSVFFIQRLSNYTHNINDKFLDKYYNNVKEVK